MTAAPASPTTPTPDTSARQTPARFSKWSHLNPIWLALGPTFQKEIRVSGRKVGTYVFRSLYIGGMLGLVTLFYFATRMGMALQPGTAQMASLQQFAPTIAITILWFQFAVLTFRAPVLTSGAICDEKRAQTLPALMTSPLVSGEIILGKLTSKVVQLLILALTAAPLLLAIRVFGGLNTRVVLAGLAVGLCGAVLTASIAMLLSVSAKKPASAAAGAIGLFVALSIAPVLIFVFLTRTTPGASFEWVTFVSTPVALGRLTTEMVGAVPPAPGPPYWAINIAINLTLAALATLYAIVSLRRVLRTESISATEFKPTRADRRRARQAAVVSTSPASASTPNERAPGSPAPDPQPAAPAASTVFRPSRTVGDHPILWHELRQKTFKSRARLIITLVLIAALLAFMYYKAFTSSSYRITGTMDESVHFLILIGSILALIAHAASASTGSITSEREGRTWQTLMSTPVSSRAILYAKLLGAIRQIWVIPLILAVHFVLVAVPFGDVPAIALVHIALIVVTTIVFLCATGLFYSLVMRRSTTASSANMGTAAVLWLALPMTLSLAMGLIPQASDAIIQALNVTMAANPVAMVGYALAGAINNSGPPYRLGSWELTAPAFTGVVLAVSAVGLAVSAGVMELAVRLMPRAGGRTS